MPKQPQDPRHRKYLFGTLLLIAQKEAGLTDDEVIQVMANLTEVMSNKSIDGESWGKKAGHNVTLHKAIAQSSATIYDLSKEIS